VSPIPLEERDIQRTESIIRRALGEAYDTAAIRRHAEQFGPARFSRAFRTLIDEAMAAPAAEVSW